MQASPWLDGDPGGLLYSIGNGRAEVIRLLHTYRNEFHEG
jgi:hypothetical protein